jgi:hypothetical protein
MAVQVVHKLEDNKTPRIFRGCPMPAYLRKHGLTNIEISFCYKQRRVPKLLEKKTGQDEVCA